MIERKELKVLAPVIASYVAHLYELWKRLHLIQCIFFHSTS